jgi:hypothetical protein
MLPLSFRIVSFALCTVPIFRALQRWKRNPAFITTSDIDSYVEMEDPQKARLLLCGRVVCLSLPWKDLELAVWPIDLHSTNAFELPDYLQFYVTWLA